MAAIATGELLKGRYRLERTLGRGGMAAVWLGHDEVLDRPVAVKVLSDTIAGDPGFVARFRREAHTAASLSHPNLVGVYDFSEEGERPYLVMQFVPGENLAARLERGEGVDREKLARELLEALVHIHRAGILHRDVKPANIVVEPDGTAKLIDFGIALPEDATALTRTGLVLGTERFAAPEVLEGQPATARSDLYSAGVVLRCCEGRCSRALASLIGWMTSRDSAARPTSARQALARLERTEATDPPTQAFEPSFERARPSLRRSRWGAAAAILGVIAALLVAALVVLGGSGQRGANAPSANAKRARATHAGGGTARAADAGESEGEYEAAVPVLEEAVRSFPEGTADVNYAYTLFNLGQALRLSGRPDEAISILERRLEFPNQTATVEAELEAARAEAGTR